MSPHGRMNSMQSYYYCSLRFICNSAQVEIIFTAFILFHGYSLASHLLSLFQGKNSSRIKLINLLVLILELDTSDQELSYRGALLLCALFPFFAFLTQTNFLPILLTSFSFILFSQFSCAYALRSTRRYIEMLFFYLLQLN